VVDAAMLVSPVSLAVDAAMPACLVADAVTPAPPVADATLAGRRAMVAGPAATEQ
jgi:hypothetical protein